MQNPPIQTDATFEDINKTIWNYLVERGWHNNPSRGLAISIALEANELLEHYQWEDVSIGDKDEIAEELADIFIYAFQFAQTNGIDIPDAITKKLEKAKVKFPAEVFKGKSGDNHRQAWLDAKLNHQKKGL